MSSTARKPDHGIPVDHAEGVRATIAAYCHALDDSRVEEIIDLFTFDGAASLPGMEPATGHAALRSLYGGLMPVAPQRHLVVNTVVTAAGDEGARAISDLVFLKVGDVGWDVALTGRYADELRHEDGLWRFVRRALTFTGS